MSNRLGAPRPTRAISSRTSASARKSATPRRAPSRSAMSRSIKACSARALRCSRRTSSRARSATAQAPLDDLLVFHVVFGKTVPDVSLNAVANLGYADCRFLKPVYPGATLNAVSEVIGLRENANRKTGIVYVRSRGFDETGDCVLDYVRWVMVRKRDENAPAPPRKSAGAAESRRAGASSAPPARRSMRRPTTPCWPAARTASATTRPARRSTMSTASRWKKPST